MWVNEEQRRKSSYRKPNNGCPSSGRVLVLFCHVIGIVCSLLVSTDGLPEVPSSSRLYPQYEWLKGVGERRIKALPKAP